MALTVGDYIEVYTEGWFSNRGTTADPTAVATFGWWNGFPSPIPDRIIEFTTEAKSAIRLYARAA